MHDTTNDCAPVAGADITLTWLEKIDPEIVAMIKDWFREEPPWVTLPYTWSRFGSDGGHNPPVADPATLHIHLPLGDGIEPAVFAISLEQVIDYMIDGESNPDGKIDDPDVVGPARSIAKRLRQLADKLESAYK